MNEARYQDRKLNVCRQCGTKKQLAPHFDGRGVLYFLCRGHSTLLDVLEKKIEAVMRKT